MYFRRKNIIIPHFPQGSHKLDPKLWIVFSWEIIGFYNYASMAKYMREEVDTFYVHFTESPDV